jgi:hypothetical protein
MSEITMPNGRKPGKVEAKKPGLVGKPVEPEQKRKKKKRPTEDAQPKADKRLNRATKRLPDLQSQASDLEEEIGSLDLEGSGGPEAVFKREYVSMLQFNAKLIKRLNTQLESTLSSRDIYALSTIMSQQREVIADLRTIVDMSEQVEMVQRQVLVPFVSDTTQLLTDVYFQLRRLITETSTPRQTQFALNQLDDLVKQFGSGLQTTHETSKDKLYQILLGDAQPATAKKRKNKK